MDLQGSTYDIWGGSSIPLQGGTGVPQGSRVQVQSPAPVQLQGTGGGVSQGVNQGFVPSGGGAVGPSAEQIAAARTAQQVAGLREEIAARRTRANSIFEALTGAVSQLAQARRSELEGDFARQTGEANEDFISQSGDISRAYVGRGLGDSSFRINALDRAGGLHQRALADLARQRASGLAKVGSEVAGLNAGISADRAAIGGINLDEIGDDTNALMRLRNDIDERIREAQVQRAKLGTDEGFRGQLNKIAPYTGVANTLKSALSSLVQAAIPQSVKDRIANGIIGSYAPQDAAIWQDWYDQETQKTATEA